MQFTQSLLSKTSGAVFGASFAVSSLSVFPLAVGFGFGFEEPLAAAAKVLPADTLPLLVLVTFCWLAFLPLELAFGMLEPVLSRLHQEEGIIPMALVRLHTLMNSSDIVKNWEMAIPFTELIRIVLGLAFD